jgi:3D (Asp-Asp-Asp) domain-containing protein
MFIRLTARGIKVLICCVSALLALAAAAGGGFGQAQGQQPARPAAVLGSLDFPATSASSSFPVQIDAIRVRHTGSFVEARHNAVQSPTFAEEVLRPKRGLIGTSAYHLSARGSGVVASPEPVWMPFTATWYSPKGGVGDGLTTATGNTVKNDWTIAVDPQVIPLYSLVEIRFPDGRTHVYQALDTGAAIVGRKVDIFNFSEDQCMQNGVQRVLLRIVRRGR